MKTEFDTFILSALKEDISSGDVTTGAIINPDIKAVGKFLVKDIGIIAGLEIVERVFKLYDQEISFTKYSDDGEEVNKGDIVAEVYGRASTILTCERTALNIFQRMSGIATVSNKYSQLIKHTKAKILDTRKTVPGLRMLDKLAVKIGGADNHRFGLYDMFLIKDNHLEVAGSITKAIRACKDFNKKNNKNLKIEVEVTNLDQLKEALLNEVDIIMLDNFTVELLKEAVKITNGKCKLEASGGINYETVKQIAETGVDYISVGAITHSVKALDISLEVILKNA